MVSRCAILFSFVVAAPAAEAATWQLTGRVATDTGYDSNVYRTFESDPQALVVGDEFLQADGHLVLSGRPGDRQRTDVTADIGTRLFPDQAPADTVVAQGEARHAIGLSRKLVLRLDAEGKDIFTGDRAFWPGDDNRAYDDYGGGATLVAGPFLATRFSVRAGYRVFDYFSDPDFSEAGPALSAELSASPARRHTLFADWRLFPQYYQGPQLAADGAILGRRFDWYQAASAGYSFAGSWVFSATYSFIDDAADSYGESFRRHRLTALLGLVLPGEVYAVATGAVQLTSYPDGLYLSPELLLLEDDDDLDEVSIKLSRDLGAHLSLELRWGYYRNDLFQNGLAYQRQVVYLGLAYGR